MSYIKIPLYDNGFWGYREYETREEYRDFVDSVFKEPGKYNLNEISFVFNEQALKYKKNGYYCPHPKGTKDYREYWDKEKEKCTKGVIYKSKGLEWYLPREYYMWINFMPINDKRKKRFDFPEVWDIQIHIALYELKAELHYKHAIITKKRQIASSYYHSAKLINHFWFDEGSVLKIGASQSKYIGMEGTWKFIEEYKDFLNTHTAWIRQLNPNKVGSWQQKIEIKRKTPNGKYITSTVGNKSTLTSTSFEKSPTSGVGGLVSYFFHEEAGVAPLMDKTYIFMKSALEMGDETTGQFIAAGSVGELKDCEPLKKYMMNPETYGFLGIETDLVDGNGTRGIRGLFLPEQWGMPPYIDQYGNSEVEKALNALNERFEKKRKEVDAAEFQLEVSQHPRNIKEAFAYREVSIFDNALCEMQKMNIEDNQYPCEYIDLKESLNGDIVVRHSNKRPIDQFPVKKNADDKEGCIVVWERPDEKVQFGTYIASIDPVEVGKTTTSDSLCSIYVYKRATHVKRYKDDDTESFIEGDKIVCAWCGRYDDLNETHKRLRLIIQWYNAWTLIENNKPGFIQYMIKERKQRYLVRKDQILFLKELSSGSSTYQEYGFTRSKPIFEKMLGFFINWHKEVINEDYDENGVSVKKYYGIQRIPDKMAMEEMLNYNDTINCDRLAALIPLIAFVIIQDSNTKMPEREETVSSNLEKNNNLYKLDRGAFMRHKSYSSPIYKKSRSAFKYRKL